MKYIESFREGDKINEIYLCKYKQSATAKNGKTYENVVLQDKTGTIDAKIWDPNSSGIEEFGVMDYVFITGDVTNFQGTLQMSIKRARRADETEYVAADYLPVSEKDLDEMYEELMALMRQVENPYLQKLIQMYFVDNEAFIDAFKHHSAAKTVHHSFVGGLLEHTLGVVKLCDFYVKQYPYLNRDLLFTAALFHDVGKLKEISNFPENDYTDDGQLLGHIVMGCELVGFGCRHIKGFPKKLISELQHCILAHHGELEYGSPKKPALPEAMALNYADNTDAKLETMREILKSAGDNREWLGFNRLFESNLRRSTEF
jgi:3'-5' exoribonuclease